MLVPPRADTEPRFHPERFEDVLDVLFHGGRAPLQDLGDLLISFAATDPLGDFQFARCGRFLLVEKP